jgi:hypothetical protein
LHDGGSGSFKGRGGPVTAVAQPYLSVVVTARNDDHGGNLLGRMQAFVNGFLNQCARHRVPAELIIVEWNPLEDRPGLAEALHWNAAHEFCDVRILEVPNELHRRFEHWRTLPLYQMIAKNAGIRRARGEFILATNIDILFSDELMSFIAARKLERGKMYRIDRWDIESNVPVDAPVEQQLAYAQSHLIRVCAREGTFRVSPDGVPVLETNDIASPDAGVRLGENWFPREMSGDEPFRWVENDAELLIDPARGSGQVLVLDVEPGPGVHSSPFWLELHDAGGNRVGSVEVKRRTIVTFPLGSASESRRLTLNAPQGGHKIATDPRTLNFRVFRCELETVSGAQKRADLARARAGQSWMSRAARGLRLLRALCTSSVQFRVPMSQRSLDRLNLRQDGSGVSFYAGPLTGLLRRSGAHLHGGVLGSGLGAVWGEGWYPAEVFRGDTIRWMRERSALVLQLPLLPVSALVFVVESGPAVGFETVELEIQDEWGTSLAKQQVRRGTRVNVPIPKAKSAISLSLIVRGGGNPKELIGESRALVLRLLRLECVVESESVPRPFQPAELRPRGRIWSGRGWKPGAAGRSLSMAERADLILRTPQDLPSRLTLRVEAGEEPVYLVIKDSYDRELFRGAVDRTGDVLLPGEFAPETYRVLRFEIQGEASPEASRLRLTRVTWATGDRPPASTLIRADRPDLAVHLHTNACGDFTMLAREHWMDLRGYPELDVFSMNVDSLFCWMAHHGGAPEEFLDSPMRIYHIEHATGSGWTPEGEQRLYTRITEKGIPWLSYDDVVEWARTMNRFNAPMIFNHEGWGFADEVLREIRPLESEQAIARPAANVTLRT